VWCTVVSVQFATILRILLYVGPVKISGNECKYKITHMYIRYSILSWIHHVNGTVILHINLYISLHTDCSWIMNIINYNVLRQVFSNSKNVLSAPFKDDWKWLEYIQIHKYSIFYVYYIFVYCVGYFIKYFLLFIRLYVICFLLGNSPASQSIVTPGNYLKENILHTEHGESLKSSIRLYTWQSANIILRPSCRPISHLNNFITFTVPVARIQKLIQPLDIIM